MQAQADQALREPGGDEETLLRVDRSVAGGLHQAAIEHDASLLLLQWPGPGDLRARMIGATFGEIITATSVPVAIAGLHPRSGGERIVVYGTHQDLVPEPAHDGARGLEVGVRACRRRDEPLVIGPVPPSALDDAGLTIPPIADHREAGEDDLRPGRRQ